MFSVFCLCLLGPELCAQQPITFQYFYDETSQLVKVVDSTGVVIDYLYDAVGNMLEIRRTILTNPGGLQILSFAPQQGGPLSTVTIQGQGFSPTAANNTVRFNGVTASVLSASATVLVVQVPVAATTGPISVTVNGGTATSTSSFTALPSPFVTSIAPKAALPNTTIASFQVTGVNLAGASFIFLPEFSPAAITVGAASISLDGTSATLNLVINSNAAGAFTLVAMNVAGKSDDFPSTTNTLNVVVDAEADSDSDGFPDGLEAEFGSDAFDPASKPDFFAKGEAISRALSVLNSISPDSGSPPTRQEAYCVLFSLLNEAGSTLITSAVEPTQAGDNERISEGDRKSDRDRPSDPSVRITSPDPASNLVEGQTVQVRAEVPEGRSVTEVVFLVNDVPLSTDISAPYEMIFTVPADVPVLIFKVEARTNGQKSFSDITIPVKPEALTTVEGRVIDSRGLPVDSARVEIEASGLVAEFYDFKTPLAGIPDLTEKTPVLRKVVSAINIRNPNNLFGNDPFGTGSAPDYAVRFSGDLKIKQGGRYRFFLGADEAARLKVHGVTIIDMQGGNGIFTERSGTTDFSPGPVPIELTYYESVGTAELQLSWVPPLGERQVITPDVLTPRRETFATTTDSLGQFSIPNVPTHAKTVRLNVSPNQSKNVLDGTSLLITTVPGATTHAGDVVLKK